MGRQATAFNLDVLFSIANSQHTFRAGICSKLRKPRERERDDSFKYMAAFACSSLSELKCTRLRQNQEQEMLGIEVSEGRVMLFKEHQMKAE